MIFTVGGAGFLEVGQAVVYNEYRKPSIATQVNKFAGYVWATLDIGETFVYKADELVLVILVSEEEYFFTTYSKEIDDQEYQYEAEYDLLHTHYDEDTWYFIQQQMER